MKKQKKVDAQEKRIKSTDQRRQEAIAKKSSKLAKKAAHVLPPQVHRQMQAPRSNAELVKRIQTINPCSDLALWAQMLGNPFRYEGVFCPVNYNPVPSFIQSTARTTYTDLSISVASNLTKQFTIFPGHYTIASDAAGFANVPPMDGVSYHANDITVNATTYVVGPMTKQDNVGTKTAIIGVVHSGVALGTVEQTTAGAPRSPMVWDVSLPYVSNSQTSTSAGHHSRWQLVAMGLRIRQVSPEINRGGNIVTVQPNNSFTPTAGASQSTLEVFPSFQDWGPDGCEISWIPRAQDLAFWHGFDASGGGTAGNIASGAGILAFLNNNTASNLAYSLELVCHWQLAGTYLNPVGGPAPHSPDLKPAVEKTLSHLFNSGPTASAAPRVAASAAQHSGAFSGQSWFQAAKAAYAVGQKAVRAGASLVA